MVAHALQEVMETTDISLKYTGPYLRVCITGKDFPEAYRALLNALEGME